MIYYRVKDTDTPFYEGEILTKEELEDYIDDYIKEHFYKERESDYEKEKE